MPNTPLNPDNLNTQDMTNQNIKNQELITPESSNAFIAHEFSEAFNETLFDSFDEGYYIGMMSGTSLDGMDAVICQFADNQITDNELEYNHNTAKATDKIIATHSKAFPSHLRDVLMALCHPNGTGNLEEPAKHIILEHQPKSELEWFGWASKEYAKFASGVVNELLESSGIDAESILAIGCHGQTVRHRPSLGFSLQLVDPNIIAEYTGISVVTDFRRRDMAVSGQGAPLAPAFHLAQFGDEENTNRIIVNLGGISNITVLPAKKPEQIIGYDTGVANMLLDAWYQSNAKAFRVADNANDLEVKGTLFENTLFDKDGAWAKTGTVNHVLLEQLLTHPYFELPTPKSTGREDFNLDWLNEQLTVVALDISAEDVQATLTAFTVQTLSNAINTEAERLALSSGNIIICGGGAYNSHLLEQLAESLPNWTIETSEGYGIAPTWVESMAFAWLARQTIMGETGNLPAVTGASKPVVLGQVCFA